MAVLFRIDLKKFGKQASDWDRDKAFRMLFHQYKMTRDDYGLTNILKENQFFESNSRKDRKKKKNMLNRKKMEDIEDKLNKGEKVHCSSKITKKIKAKNLMKKKNAQKEKYNQAY